MHRFWAVLQSRASHWVSASFDTIWAPFRRSFVTFTSFGRRNTEAWREAFPDVRFEEIPPRGPHFFRRHECGQTDEGQFRNGLRSWVEEQERPRPLIGRHKGRPRDREQRGAQLVLQPLLPTVPYSPCEATTVNYFSCDVWGADLRVNGIGIMPINCIKKYKWDQDKSFYF